MMEVVIRTRKSNNVVKEIEMVIPGRPLCNIEFRTFPHLMNLTTTECWKLKLKKGK